MQTQTYLYNQSIDSNKVTLNKRSVLDKRLVTEDILRSETLIGINRCRELETAFANYFRFAINTFMINDISNIQPKFDFNVLESVEMITSVANSFIKLKSANNIEILCLLAHDPSLPKFSNNTSLYFFTGENNQDVLTSWNVFQVFLKFNLTELILSNFNSKKIEVNYLYSSFSLNNKLTEAIAWAKGLLKTILGFYLRIASNKTDNYMTEPTLFDSYDKLDSLISSMESQKSFCERLIKDTELVNETSIKMKEMEDSLLEVGAVPGRDYTYISLLQLVKEKFGL